MDIIIRNLEKRTVVALDDLAIAQRKSRNEYLKEQLTLLANRPILQEQEERYQSLLEQALAVIKENTQVIEKLMR
ncbi:hypothetical protein OBO34_11240 [Clostridiales Family XIII bacterium ASD5510]|uniref:Uncharacterized protein n=1 Tax=Hominibacterium faecale TaxID=2839743 RepID=A0A9J6QS26_9FIRM|nr:hypothetical protein [Hominibacterium faecale]MCU7378930.1 hypothetical protein [Hominibacterium faecale]